LSPRRRSEERHFNENTVIAGSNSVSLLLQRFRDYCTMLSASLPASPRNTGKWAKLPLEEADDSEIGELEDLDGTVEGDIVATLDGDKQIYSIWRIVGMFSFAFTNGTLLSTYPITTLPTEAARMDEGYKSIILGVLLGLAGVTQLSGPIAGLYSDRCTNSYGKRRPFILCGGICGGFGLMLQWVASYYEIWSLYFLAFCFSMLALNVIFSSMIGLVPDLIHSDQSGAANGAIAMLSSLGALVGYGIWSFVEGNTRTMYWYYLALLVLSVGITVLTVKETPQEATPDEQPVTWSDIRLSFWISPTLHHDFFMVFVSRSFYYMGISSMAFFLYYLKDMIHVPNPESTVSLVSMLGLACAATTAYPTGMLSDYLGNGRKIYIYVANVVMAAGSIALAFADSLTPVYILMCLIGAFEGCYLTMDYAIAMDTIPNQEEAARFMGVWGVAAFLGTALGPMISGPLLYFVGQTDVSGEFSRAGYAILWISSAIYLLIGAYLVKFVRSVK